MLTQAEADYLIGLEKRFVDLTPISLPSGLKQIRELVGTNAHEHFLMDLWRGTIRLTKVSLQTRVRSAVILVRLDIDSAPHTNPDGERISGTHLHVYREGFEDRWAKPLDPQHFSNPGNISQSFEDFCFYCNIISKPPFQASLV